MFKMLKPATILKNCRIARRKPRKMGRVHNLRREQSRQKNGIGGLFCVE